MNARFVKQFREMQDRLSKLERGLRKNGMVPCACCGEWCSGDLIGCKGSEYVCYDCVECNEDAFEGRKPVSQHEMVRHLSILEGWTDRFGWKHWVRDSKKPERMLNGTLVKRWTERNSDRLGRPPRPWLLALVLADVASSMGVQIADHSDPRLCKWDGETLTRNLP